MGIFLTLVLAVAKLAGLVYIGWGLVLLPVIIELTLWVLGLIFLSITR
jgi:hypothetical protein